MRDILVPICEFHLFFLFFGGRRIPHYDVASIAKRAYSKNSSSSEDSFFKGDIPYEGDILDCAVVDIRVRCRVHYSHALKIQDIIFAIYNQIVANDAITDRNRDMGYMCLIQGMPSKTFSHLS